MGNDLCVDDDVIMGCDVGQLIAVNIFRNMTGSIYMEFMCRDTVIDHVCHLNIYTYIFVSRH